VGRYGFACGHDSRPVWIALASKASLDRYRENQLVFNNAMALAGMCALVHDFLVHQDAYLPTAVCHYVAVAQTSPFSFFSKQLNLQVKRFLLFPLPPHPVAPFTQQIVGTVAGPLK